MRLDQVMGTRERVVLEVFCAGMYVAGITRLLFTFGITHSKQGVYARYVRNFDVIFMFSGMYTFTGIFLNKTRASIEVYLFSAKMFSE